MCLNNRRSRFSQAQSEHKSTEVVQWARKQLIENILYMHLSAVLHAQRYGDFVEMKSAIASSLSNLVIKLQYSQSHAGPLPQPRMNIV